MTAGVRRQGRKKKFAEGEGSVGKRGESRNGVGRGSQAEGRRGRGEVSEEVKKQEEERTKGEGWRGVSSEDSVEDKAGGRVLAEGGMEMGCRQPWRRRAVGGSGGWDGRKGAGHVRVSEAVRTWTARLDQGAA